MRFIIALLIGLFPSSGFSQVVIDDGTDTSGGVTFEEEDTSGNIEFQIDLGGKVKQEFFYNGKRLEDKNGKPVTAYNITPDGSTIIGTTSPNVDRVTINKTADIAKGKKAISSFIRKDGKHKSLPDNEITAHRNDGSNTCFSVAPIGTAQNPLAAHILIDRSGSMGNHMPAVKRAVQQFTFALPPASTCKVTSFSGSSEEHTNGFEQCRSVPSKIANLSAWGGTSLFDTMIDGYNTINQSQATQSFMMIISDGADTSSTTLDQVRAAKNTKTFVLWAGRSSPDYLGDIPDASLDAGQNIPAALTVFFQSLGQALAQQQVLIVPNQC